MAKQRFRDIKKSKKTKEIPDVTKYASCGLKVKAFLTDAFMLLMPIMYVIIYLVMDGREGFAEQKLLGWFYILFPLILIQSIFMYFTGQTPGYKAYTIELIDERTKEKPSFLIILFRNTTAILSVLTLIGWILMFFRKDHKTLHDLLSATAVINKK